MGLTGARAWRPLTDAEFSLRCERHNMEQAVRALGSKVLTRLLSFPDRLLARRWDCEALRGRYAPALLMSEGWRKASEQNAASLSAEVRLREVVRQYEGLEYQLHQHLTRTSFSDRTFDGIRCEHGSSRTPSSAHAPASSPVPAGRPLGAEPGGPGP